MSGRKVTFHWPLRPQKSKALHPGYLTIVFVVSNSRVPRGRESVMVQQQPVVPQQRVQKQQHQEHQGLSLSSACKPTPLKVSRAEMMQERERHTHSSRICACTHPRIRAHLHSRTSAQTCVQRCTHNNKRLCKKVHALHAHLHMYTHAHIHACMYKPQHARKCIRTCTHPRIHTTISAHAYSRTRKQANHM